MPAKRSETVGSESQHYEIRVRGPVGPTVMEAFPCLTATRDGQDTQLAGSLPDQSALYGVIHELEALGLQLLEIRRSTPSADPVSDQTPRRGSLSPSDRKLLIGSLGVLLAVFALVASNVAANHSPKPHSLPIGIVGTPTVADAAADELSRAAPGAFKVHAYRSLASARTAVLHRSIYGAFQPTPAPVLLEASAASPPVALLLQRTFAKPAGPSGRAPAVHDLVPLPSSDSSGATSFSVILSLILAGLAGTSLVYALTRHCAVAVRVAVIAGIAAGAGLVTALVTNVLVGAYPGHFFAVWGVATLFVLAISLPIAAFQVFFGVAGTAIGWLLFLVIGNPASGGSSAPELLPGFWRTLSQILPPGAAVTSLRDVVYFNGHGSAHALVILAVYAALGAGVALTVHTLRRRAGAATTADQNAEHPASFGTV
ncbi:MAG: hypothetical protein FWD04_07460 [Conexibacteraceae bacterium]|nr:hypothetical protein [Conexibacteraceae bacterium]